MPASGMDDIRNSYVNGLTIPPATYTSTQVGTAVNLQPGTGPVAAIIAVGAISSTSTCVITFTESATSGGTFTSVVGSTSVTVVAATQNTFYVSQLFERSLPWVKATATIGGSSISVPLSVVFVENSTSF